MDKLVIEGGVRLKGEVAVSGSKNSVFPIYFGDPFDGGCLHYQRRAGVCAIR